MKIFSKRVRMLLSLSPATPAIMLMQGQMERAGYPKPITT